MAEASSLDGTTPPPPPPPPPAPPPTPVPAVTVVEGSALAPTSTPPSTPTPIPGPTRRMDGVSITWALPPAPPVVDEVVVSGCVAAAGGAGGGGTTVEGCNEGPTPAPAPVAVWLDWPTTSLLGAPDGCAGAASAGICAEAVPVGFNAVVVVAAVVAAPVAVELV